MLVNTSNADGTPNEMMALGTTGTGVSRLIVGPINTTGMTSLNLQFNQVMSCSDTANLSLRVQSSVNGTTWTNEGFTLDEISYNCANTINITINSNVGSTTYLAWSIIGNHSLIDNWYIDDIIFSETYSNDVGIFSIGILSPRDNGTNRGTGRIILKNEGINIQSFPVQMTITGGYSSTKIVANLAAGNMRSITFDDWDPTPGLYIVNVCTQLAGDQNPLNDCRSKEILVVNNSQAGFQSTVNVNNGWNMVSIPGLHPLNQNTDLWWAGRDQAASVYKFEGGYQSVTSLEPGTGYWMKHSGNQTYNTGDEWPTEGIVTVSHLPVVVNTGWNLIGGYEGPFPTDNILSIPPDLISSPVYKFSGGYQVADTLIAGFGYWVYTSGTGQLMIDTSCIATPLQLDDKKKENTELFKENMGRIILSDVTGNSYTLYAVNTQEDLSKYELPPLPPAGIFDIRYSSGRIAEDLNSPQIIELNGVEYPVTIRVENMGIKLTDVYTQEISKELQPGEELIIQNNLLDKLSVQSSQSNTPVVYALDQNFPNPFNPTTQISWQAPADGMQTLKVFDVLGNEVAVLVNEFRPAGRYEAKFEASNLASGIYIYKLQAGEFVQTRKMILLK